MLKKESDVKELKKDSDSMTLQSIVSCINFQAEQESLLSATEGSFLMTQYYGVAPILQIFHLALPNYLVK